MRQAVEAAAHMGDGDKKCYRQQAGRVKWDRFHFFVKMESWRRTMHRESKRTKPMSTSRLRRWKQIDE